MTSLRLDFQRMTVRNFPDAQVLNVGCNIDPAYLKDLFGERVTNADLSNKDEVLGLEYEVDLLFDITSVWPLDNNSYDLVILGDIIEHLHELFIPHVLGEAHRVAERVCITVPNDARLGPGWNEDGSRLPEDQWVKTPGSYHVTQVTEESLRKWLDDSSWEIEDWQTVHYHFTEEGYFVIAKRKYG